MRHRRTWIDVAACASLSTLCFSSARLETLYLGDWDFYNRTPLSAMVLGTLLLNIALLGGAGFGALRLVRATSRPLWRRLAVAGVILLLLIPLDTARRTYETPARWAEAVGWPGPTVVVAALVAVSCYRYRIAARVLRIGLLLVSPLFVFTCLHVLSLLADLAILRRWPAASPTPLVQPAPSLRRVVWLMFDGLDQRVVYEARPAGLQLPELDRLRGESLYAVGAHPPGGAVEVAMPALLTGRRVVGVEPISADDAVLKFADGVGMRWSTHATVFSRARARGYDTAVLGWGLPYPRVMGAALGAADWRPSVAHESARDATFSGTVVSQWSSMAPALNGRRLLRDRVAGMLAPAVTLAADTRFAVVLVHLPLPDMPAIYDRATGRLTAWSPSRAVDGYFDNLALVDRVVGEMRARMQRAGVIDRTWLVVSSVRSWRDASKHDGRADPRVPFLVRPPGRGRAVPVDIAFGTVITHDLLLALLSGEVDTTEAAAAWLARRAPPPPQR